MAVLGQAPPVGNPQFLGQTGGEEVGARGDVDDYVRLKAGGAERGGQALAEADPLAGHQPPVHHRILAGEVDVLEDAVGLLPLAADPGVHLLVPVDEDRLPGLQVAHHLEVEMVEAGRLRREGVAHPCTGDLAAHDQGADPVGVAERQQAVVGDDRHRRVGALDLLLGGGHAVEHVVDGEVLEVFGLQLGGEGVEDEGHVVGGVHQPVVLLVEVAAQVGEVDHVAVVHHGQPEGVVHHDGLGVEHVAGAGGGVAHVTQAHRGGEAVQAAVAEHLGGQAQALAQVEGPVEGDDPGGILAPMLDSGQPLEQLPRHVAPAADAQDPAHLVPLARAEPTGQMLPANRSARTAL